ncbi:hypothetical protein HZA45_00820 [Candidatus Peregrinibacteria bacterium]|nr:hypothetical protein [Candidatus Peregrinibacteria bacterium]
MAKTAEISYFLPRQLMSMSEKVLCDINDHFVRSLSVSKNCTIPHLIHSHPVQSGINPEFIRDTEKLSKLRTFEYLI